MDELDGAAGFWAVEHGAFAVVEAAEEVFEVAAVLGVVDGGGVGGAGAGGVGLGAVLGEDFGVFGERVLEVPDGELAIDEEDGAFGAAELDLGGVPGVRIRGGGAFDDAEGSVAEAEGGDGDVFDFDAGVADGAELGGDGGDVAGEVEEEVDGVDRLVHEGASAAEFPGAAPDVGVVVGLGAVPLDGGAGEGELAEASGGDGALYGCDGGVEAAGEDAGEADVVGVAGGDEGVCPVDGGLDGFFDEEVLAGAGGGEAGLEVSPAGGGDGDDVEIGVGEEFLVVGMGVAAVGGGEGGGFFGGSAEDGDEVGVGDVCDGFGVEGADHAAADDADAVLLAHACWDLRDLR